MSREFSLRKDSQSTKFERIFVKLSFRDLCNSKFYIKLCIKCLYYRSRLETRSTVSPFRNSELIVKIRDQTVNYLIYLLLFVKNLHNTDENGVNKENTQTCSQKDNTEKGSLV